MNKKSKPDSLGIVCGCGGLGVLVLVGWWFRQVFGLSVCQAEQYPIFIINVVISSG